MKSLKEKIEVMQAADDGKEIEYQNDARGSWHGFDGELPLWNWGSTDYRTKPEPMEFWVNVYGGVYTTRAHKTEAEARKECKDSQVNIIKTIKVREVL